MNRSPLMSRVIAALRWPCASVAAVPVVVLVVISLVAVAAVVATPDDATSASASTVSGMNRPDHSDGTTTTTTTSRSARTGDIQLDEAAPAREPGPTGPRGVITAGDAPASAATTSPTAVAPVALDPVEGPAPVIVPPSEPNDVDILEGPGGWGAPADLVAVGSPCQLGCITRATLHRELRSTDVRIRMETSIKARMWVGVFEEAPLWINGSPVVGDAVTRRSLVARASWETAITGLDANTTYHVIVRARDGDGNDHYESTDFTTVTPVEVADTLVATPSGCLYQCIESGVVAAITHEAALLQVQTSAPATLGVWVSTSEPGWIGGSPILPATAAIPLPMALQSSWNVPVGGLEPETTYHVVVRATDDQGRYSSRVGHFTTPVEPPTPIEVTIRQIHVFDDGDDRRGKGSNISFAWGAAHQLWGSRNSDEIHDGTTIVIDAHNSRIVSVEPGAFLPRFMVSALGLGPTVGLRACEVGLLPTVTSEPYSDDACGVYSNAASTGLQTVASVASLLSCSSYGVIGDGEDDRCDIIFSADGLGDHFPGFWVLVSYRFV